MVLVEEVMTTNPIVAQIPGGRNEVLKIMVKHNLTGLPVVKRSDGALAGLITRQDIFDKADEDQLALIMNKNPETIGPKETVNEAARLFLERNIHHLPVVEGGNLLGIVTPTNLLEVAEGEGGDCPVENVIHSPCVPIYQDAPLAVALVTFKVSNASALPVLDDGGRLVGILTDRDIFNKSHINGSVAISDLGIGQDEDDWTWEGLRNVMKLWYEVSKIEIPGLPVKEIMVPSPTTVFRKTTVSEAARIMRKNDFGQLPVRDSKDKLLAMIYDIDIISVLAEES
jgi:CBS domain-containing protein